jgi:Tfp pilus assembly protein FimV
MARDDARDFREWLGTKAAGGAFLTAVRGDSAWNKATAQVAAKNMTLKQLKDLEKTSGQVGKHRRK